MMFSSSLLYKLVVGSRDLYLPRDPLFKTTPIVDKPVKSILILDYRVLALAVYVESRT